MQNVESGDERSADQKIQDEQRMAKAMDLANRAFAANEVPVGAVIIDAEGRIIGEGWNQSISCHDPTAHAEIQAIRQAGQSLTNYRLVNCTLYVTLEPCTMCVGAIVHSRLSRVVFGALEPKAGAIVSASNLFEAPYFNHRVEWSGDTLAKSCGELMSSFFSKRRAALKGQSKVKKIEK
ncbi:MAG: tRNA adenosine(34) deaminase TadA [Pseudomonadales bacterium]|nr:tRNA adenosine(34) deaminase TadA [Pseudomonadales bacterium]